MTPQRRSIGLRCGAYAGRNFNLTRRSRCRSRPCLRWRYRADRSGTCQSGDQPPASRHLSGYVQPRPGVAQFPRPGPEQIPVPAIMVLPRRSDGTGKTGPADRRRDLPDLMRSTGAGIPRAGQPVSGHGDIRRRPPDLRNAGRTGARPVARRVFCRWRCRDSCGFFTGGIAQIPAQPLRRFSRAFQGGISFRKNTRFVSDFSREKFPEWLQSVVGGGNPKRNEMQKNSHAEVGKCGASHPRAPPPGRTRDFVREGAASGGSQHAVGKAFHSLPAFLRGRFRGSASPFGKTCIPQRRHRAKRRCDLPTPDECRNFCQAASHTS